MGRHNLYILMRKTDVRLGFALALLLAVCSACALWACTPSSEKSEHTASTPVGPLAPLPPDGLTAWIADWDLDRGMAEWKAHPGLFDSVRVFAAYFNQQDEPYLSPQWSNLLGDDVRHTFGSTPVFLTVVNDLSTPSGKGNKLKDPELVQRLVSSPEARAKHIEALLALVRRHRFQGLEIDYENVTPSVWPEFLVFVRELYQRTQAEGVSLAVLLQPQRRYLEAALPVGPSYVLMGYNLFGFHSGPGPKATPKFLAEQADALRNLGVLDVTRLALATGGFDWTAPRAAKQLGEAEASSLLAKQKAATSRDADNGYLVSHYTDGKGQRHDVWHADAQTFATLWRAAQSAGFSRLAIWRLGGNSPALFDWLATLKH